MKTVLLVALALVGCTSSPDPGEHHASARIEDRCGQAAQIPPMSPTAVSAVQGDADHVLVATQPWNAQVAWTAAIGSWAGCVEPLLDADISAACGASPKLPAWSYTTADSGHVMVSAKVWSDHSAWSDAMASWSDCVEPAIEAQP
jgi:hypothetical protein